MVALACAGAGIVISGITNTGLGLAFSSVVIAYTYWDLPGVAQKMRAITEADKGSIGHSGEMETSMQFIPSARARR